MAAAAHPTVWIETCQTPEAAKNAVAAFLNSINEPEELTESVYAAAASKTFFTELEGAHISTLRSPGLVCGSHAFDRGDGSALQLNVGRRHLFGTKRWNVCFKPCNDSMAGWTRCDYDEWLQRVQALGGWEENGYVFYPEDVIAAEDF